MKRGIIFGIAGPTASGKTTVAKHLAETLGAHRAKYSDILIDLAKARRLTIDKATLQAISNEVRAQNGNDYLGLMLWKRLETVETKTLVIEGNRLMDDMKFLERIAEEEGKDLVLIYIDADTDTRFARMNGRLKETGASQISRETFETLEADPCEEELPFVRDYIKRYGTVIDSADLSIEVLLAKIEQVIAPETVA